MLKSIQQVLPQVKSRSARFFVQVRNLTFLAIGGFGAISVEAARAERFLNSRRRAKNPADALCTREEGACPEKEAERSGKRKKREGRDKDVRYFLSSYTRPETSALPLFFQKTMSDSHGRVESFWLSISGKKLSSDEFQGDRWKNIAANSPSRKGSTVWSTDFLPSISMALF